MTTTASHALAGTVAWGRSYIARGWPAFILSPSKVPVANCARCRAEHVRPAQMEACDCLTCHGFYAATTDPERLAEMARRHPRGLLAIRTGKPSGLVVMDVDGPAGIATMRELQRDGMLPRTLTQRTGGGGYHLLYAHPGQRIPTVPGGAGDHLDVKADGGYIVGAPSIHPDTGDAYQWLPAAGDVPAPLPAAWIPRLAERPAPQLPSVPVARPGAYGLAALEGEIARLEEAAPGQRNHMLNKAGYSLYRLVAAGVLSDETVTARLWHAADSIGLARDDPGGTRRTIASARRAGLSSPRRPA